MGGGKSLLCLLRYLLHKPIIKSIIRDRKFITSRLKLYSLLAFYHNAYSFKQWLLNKYFSKDHPEYVIYTFWFHANTTAVALFPKGIKVKCITRAHRYDIYDNQVIYRSHYLREMTLSKLAEVYVVSQNGTTYLQDGYPRFASKIKTTYLGSTKFFNGFSHPNQNLKRLTFLSVSRLHPVKRVPLIYTFLSHLAYRFPRLEIKWIHVGDGEEFEIIKGQIDKRKPENFTVQLIGAIPNKDVQNLYLAQPIDWFITLSSSEGIPISICEALSYGVSHRNGSWRYPGNSF